MKKLILIFFFLANVPISAQKFGYVNSEFILSNMKEYKSAMGEIENLSKAWEKEISDMYIEIEKKEIELKTEQILLITHSPQVAAKANKHWKVSKKISEDGFPISFTRELDEDSKKKELARMISGKVVTKEAIAAAEKLMP